MVPDLTGEKLQVIAKICASAIEIKLKLLHLSLTKHSDSKTVTLGAVNNCKTS